MNQFIFAWHHDMSLRRILRYLFAGMIFVIFSHVVSQVEPVIWIAAGIIAFEISFLCLKPSWQLFTISFGKLLLSAVIMYLFLFMMPDVVLWRWNEIQSHNPYKGYAINNDFMYSVQYIKFVISITYLFACGLRLHFYVKNHL